MPLQRVFKKDTQYVSSADISNVVDHLTIEEIDELVTKVILLGGSIQEVQHGHAGMPAWVIAYDGSLATSAHRYSIARAAAEFLILYGVLPNTGPV